MHPDLEPLPAHQVRPSLWALPIALTSGSVGHVMSYAFETTAGVVLIDPGTAEAASLAALRRQLVDHLGAGLEDVVGVIATHGHVDHAGAAARIRDVSGAWFALNRADADWLRRQGAAGPDDLYGERWLRELGVPDEERSRFRAATARIDALGAPTEPDLDLCAGLDLPLEGWELSPEHLPGHTAGHVGIRVEGHGVVISGDHILPGIGFIVTPPERPDTDPLGDYVASLRRSADRWDGSLILPGHGRPFTDVRERARKIERKIARRLAQVQTLVGSGLDTAWDVARAMPWRGGWDRRTTHSQRAALGMTQILLRHLELADALQAGEGTPRRFRSVAVPADV